MGRIQKILEFMSNFCEELHLKITLHGRSNASTDTRTDSEDFCEDEIQGENEDLCFRHLCIAL